MGLDMYFEAIKSEYKSFYNWSEGKDETNYPEDLKSLGDAIYNRNFKSMYVEVRYQIGYFRKFNALHNFIVNKYADGVDECQRIFIRKENIEEMLNVCEQISDNHKLASELMPTGSGFFFGSTEYDEWYYNDIESAIDLFKLMLDNDICNKYKVYYQASW